MFDFLHYFGTVFQPYHFAILLFGTAGGLIMGALPGLSPTMAVALLIPFTFHMEPAAGLILLGAVYTATVAGGAVSAILLKIPGAPANIATALDGHELAKQGKAAQALQLSFLSSGVGGVLGVLVLIFFTPILAGLGTPLRPVPPILDGNPRHNRHRLPILRIATKRTIRRLSRHVDFLNRL